MAERTSIPEINGLDRGGFVEKFGPLYEHSPWVAEEAYGARPFTDLAGLHEAFRRAVQDASQERKLALIRAHPDLAGKAAMAKELTSESTREQASAGLDRLSPGEYESFTKLNDAYKEKFDFPMVVAVREHSKDSILANARTRLENSREDEIDRALQEIAKIARYRLEETVEEGEQT